LTSGRKRLATNESGLGTLPTARKNSRRAYTEVMVLGTKVIDRACLLRHARDVSLASGGLAAKHSSIDGAWRIRDL
jgi:hypothetical protein